jgi:lipopolysaccharide transport system ATP-binding protein
MSNTVIKVEDLSKQYRLGQVSTGTISHDVNRWWHRLRGKEDPYLKIGETNDRTSVGNSEYVWALKDINFEVKQGEVLGIIGRNGAGKSTLLKILSRTTAPTTGSIKIKGRVASLLEVGTGFHPELSGRENIFLNGAILGMTKKEVIRKFDEIVAFAGVERYIDTPVKRYSSGMYVRLAFAVAAHLEPEILIVDEVLAVGDAEFQKKCIGKMKDVSEKEGRTVLFVSHDLNAIKSFCTKTILIANGEIQAWDTTKNVIEKYLSDDKSHIYQSSKGDKDGLFVESIVVTDESKKPKNIFDFEEDIYLHFKLSNTDNKTDINGQYDLFNTISDLQRKKIFSAETKLLANSYTLKISGNQLTKGSYYLETMINIPKHGSLEHLKDVIKFEILDDRSWMFKHGDHDCGSVFGNYKWI